MLFTATMARRARQAAVLAEYAEAEPRQMASIWREILYIAGGLMLLALGANLLIDGAVSIARAAGISETMIGMTVVAAGTTLPELITSVVAARRRAPDIAVGNVVGSNIFNILGVMGLAGMLRPIHAPEVAVAEVMGMVVLALVVLPIMWRGFVVNRIEGALLICAYAASFYFIGAGA